MEVKLREESEDALMISERSRRINILSTKTGWKSNLFKNLQFLKKNPVKLKKKILNSRMNIIEVKIKELEKEAKRFSGNAVQRTKEVENKYEKI